MQICPKCGHKERYGEFCEKCGTRLDRKLEWKVCPTCGHRAKHGEYCISCGGRLDKNTSSGTPGLGPILITLGVIIFIGLAAIVGLMVLSVSGIFQSSSDIKATIEEPVICGNKVDYSVRLDDVAGNPVPNQIISTYANGILLENLTTDQNGRISISNNVPLAWCGKRVNITSVYLGDFSHKMNFTSRIIMVQIPTRISISAPKEAENGTEVLVNISLVDPVRNKTIEYKQITVKNGILYNITTDAHGYAGASVTFNKTGLQTINAKYNGDSVYLPSESEVKSINIIPKTCGDGTVVGDCSKQIGYLCNQTKQLIFDCSSCGCPQGSVCYNNTCLTEAQHTTMMVSQLQKSMVYIEHSYATGSGVIIEQKDGKTVILTNKHVVKDASGIFDVKITTADGINITAADIRTAPHDMDLAVVYVNGKYGTPAIINYTEQTGQGEDVFALGSPLQLQGSVSKGIISNSVDFNTSTGYHYYAIQTDASVNPGNSGGGLFLKSSSALIGINTFGFLLPVYGTPAQGLNFAIDIKELRKLTDYSGWEAFAPVQRCYDETPYGYCSIYNDGAFCDDGGLVDACSLCGCSSGYVCLYDERCFYCPNGDAFSAQGGDAICCPKGWNAWADGSLFCCPPGEVGYTDGTCG